MDRSCKTKTPLENDINQMRLGPVEIKRFRSPDKTLDKLYDQFKEFTMIPPRVFRSNLELIGITHPEHAIVECGVWRGGMIAAMAALLNGSNSYYLFDSFEGLPKAKPIDGEAAIEWQKNVDSPGYHNNCTAEIGFVETALKMAKVKKYEIIKGWFEKTLPEKSTEIDKISVLRLDCDWYDSVMVCLDFLYPKVVGGGLIIIDDYFTWDGCSKAVHDYLSKHDLADRIDSTADKVCYIKKVENS